MMKRSILLLFLPLIFGSAQAVFAQAEGQATLGVGQQKTVAAGNKFKIKFISVMEDSRCPADVKCVWAGNAKIKIQVSMAGGETKVFEINTTNGGPLGGQIDSYAVTLTSLTPARKSNKNIRSRDYRATIVIRRITR
jgi:hypothetical protein